MYADKILITIYSILTISCLCLAGGNYYYWMKWNETRQEVTILQHKVNARNKEINHLRTQFTSLDKQKLLTKNTAKKHIKKPIRKPAKALTYLATKPKSQTISESQEKHNQCVKLKKMMDPLDEKSSYYKKLQDQFYDLNCIIRHNDYF